VNCAVLYSGGKDSAYAAFLASKNKHHISCLITIISKNPESYMFHTPSIKKVKKQAEVMNIPLIQQVTKGKKEKAIKEYEIEAIITGAIKSVYQASRVKKICDKLKLECINPLWQKDQFELLEELVKNKFKILIIGVFAYPLDDSWLGRIIDSSFIFELQELFEKYKINPAGEGGEFETFVLNCPLFNRELKIIDKKITGKGNSWKMDIDIL